MEQVHWETYHQLTNVNKPRPTLVEAFPYLTSKESALELGAGTMNDVHYLINQGFEKVVAIDKHIFPDHELDTEIEEGRIEYHETSFEAYDFGSEQFDMINAQFSLPFVAQQDIDKVMARVLRSLKPHGVFVGQFLGLNDEWNGHLTMNFQTEETIRNYFKGMEIVTWKEEEADRATAFGYPKHWHLFYVTARKI